MAGGIASIEYAVAWEGSPIWDRMKTNRGMARGQDNRNFKPSYPLVILPLLARLI